jgi:uncharacterized protein YaaW (UPF0174 family)
MDKDLEFLLDCTNEQLKTLADTLSYDEKGCPRIGESLTKRKGYAQDYPDEMNKLVPYIVDELLKYGDNFSKFTGGIIPKSSKNISYRELLTGVCDQFKVKYNDYNSVEEIESFFMREVLHLSPKNTITDEDIEHVVNKRSRKEDLKNIIGALLADPLLVNEIVNPSYKIVAPCVVIIAKYRFDHNNEINNLEE